EVAEEILVGAKIHEKRAQQRINGDGLARPIRPPRPSVKARVDENRREANAAMVEIVIPEAGHEEKSSGSPAVVRGTPDPAQSAGHPVTGAPAVPILLVNPNARHINGIGTGL